VFDSATTSFRDQEHKNYGDTAASIVDLEWWKVFHDPQLQSLLRHAIDQNRDIAVAIARVDEARALLGAVRADQLPRIDLSGSGRRDGVSEAVNEAAPLRNDWALLGRLSYEVDIWGRFASATESQRAQLLAAEETQKTVTLTIVAEVAAAYLRLLDLDRQIIIAERTLQNRRAHTQLIAARFKGGYTAKIDLNQAQIQEHDAAVALVNLKRAERLVENSLSVLIGDVPHPIERASADSNPLALSDIPIGVPAELLERRPDVRTAEELARAALMQIGVARATQFPSISLFGILGLNSVQVSELFTEDGRMWSVGGSLIGPLIDFGQSWSRTEAAEARAVQAMQAYEATVLRAVREVEDARIAVATYHQEWQIRQEQVQSAQSANMLSRRRYDDGITSYLEVLNTETSLFTAELANSATQQLYLASIVQVYKALGGGWRIQ
jgi:multidrug efflux system outer membrane protein